MMSSELKIGSKYSHVAWHCTRNITIIIVMITIINPFNASCYKLLLF